MRKFSTPLLSIALVFSISCHADNKLDPTTYLESKGFTPYKLSAQPRSPKDTVAPVMYSRSESNVTGPVCAVLVSTEIGKKINLFNIAGPEPGEDMPYCLGMPSIALFKFQNTEYISIEYVTKETRQDIARYYSYLRQDSSHNFIPDEALNSNTDGEDADLASLKPSSARTLQGIKTARIFLTQRANPGWQLLAEHFISDTDDSFAILTKANRHECLFVAEAGGPALALPHHKIVPDSKCAKVLASGKLINGGKKFYLGMFSTETGKRKIALVSIDKSGNLVSETELANTLNKNGAISDIKSAKDLIPRKLR